jgi:hypothetical protein
MPLYDSAITCPRLSIRKRLDGKTNKYKRFHIKSAKQLMKSRATRKELGKLRPYLYNGMMRVFALLPLMIIAAVAIPASAQQTVQDNVAHLAILSDAPPSAPHVLVQTTPYEIHRFWDRTNILLFSGVATSRAMDYVSTKNMLSRGRQEILIPDDVVYSSAGFPALEAAATGTSIGISYLLHRTGHHSLERWLSIGHIAVTDFGVARNYSLKSRRR